MRRRDENEISSAFLLHVESKGCTHTTERALASYQHNSLLTAMVASSSLVNVAEDAELRLVSLLAESASNAASFQSDCEACIESGDARRLIQTVLNDASCLNAFYQMESTEEAVGAFSILAALLERSAAPELSESLVQAIMEVQSNDNNNVERTIAILSVLYNMRSDSTQKCAILNRLFQLAGQRPNEYLAMEDQTLGGLLTEDASSSSLVTPAVPRLVSMLDSWNIDVQDRRNLYQTVASVLPDTDKRHQRFLLLLVETYKDNKVDEQGLQAAKNAAVGAIRDPVSLFLHQRNLLNQPAVQALSKDHKVLLGLLQVFQEGKISDYQTFLQSNGGQDKVLTPYGLDPAQCERYMKILSLCSLAAEHEEIPYKVIADTLQLPESEVESWVIAAVSSGLLEAKMDQLTQKVMVERCVVRRFDMEQWKILQSRLQAWKENVGNILSSLKQSQAVAAPATN